LVEVDWASAEPRKRIYRAVYGDDFTLRWTFALDAEGKILEVDYDWE